MTPRAAIVGLSGPVLTPEEAALLRAERPLGAILFARNVAAPAQLRALTAAIREILGAEAPILVDQGTSDNFLDTQLKPGLLKEACGRARVPLELRMREGYDHSYFFIATFVADHLRFHAQALGPARAVT